MNEDPKAESNREDLTHPAESQAMELEEQDIEHVKGGTWTWTDGGKPTT